VQLNIGSNWILSTKKKVLQGVLDWELIQWASLCPYCIILGNKHYLQLQLDIETDESFSICQKLTHFSSEPQQEPDHISHNLE
jgi:hypothetical protein